jgi:hypothetical protein
LTNQQVAESLADSPTMMAMIPPENAAAVTSAKSGGDAA